MATPVDVLFGLPSLAGKVEIFGEDVTRTRGMQRKFYVNGRNLQTRDGNVKWDVFTRPDGGARTTIFTSFATNDQRPVVTNGDPSAINAGIPEVLEWLPGEALEVDTIVTTATPAWSLLTVVCDKE